MIIKNIILILIVIFSLQVVQAQTPAGKVVFIVHSDNPNESITVAELRDYYFKRKRRWDNGESVRFMDRMIGPLRDNFLKKYIGKTNSDIELYWIGQKLYSGDSAPIKENSDSTTMNFVGSLKGAIGYISDSTALKKNIKVIKIDMTGE